MILPLTYMLLDVEHKWIQKVSDQKWQVLLILLQIFLGIILEIPEWYNIVGTCTNFEGENTGNGPELKYTSADNIYQFEINL